MIVDVDFSHYLGKVGDPIRVRVLDDVEVTADLAGHIAKIETEKDL